MIGLSWLYNRPSRAVRPASIADLCMFRTQPRAPAPEGFSGATHSAWSQVGQLIVFAGFECTHLPPSAEVKPLLQYVVLLDLRKSHSCLADLAFTGFSFGTAGTVYGIYALIAVSPVLRVMVRVS